MTPYAIAFAEDAAEPTVGYYRSLEIEGEIYAQVADVLEEHDLLIAPVFGVPALPASFADYDIEVIYRHGHDPHLQHVQPLPGARRAVRPFE